MMKALVTGLIVASLGVNVAFAGDYYQDRPSKSYYSYKPNELKYKHHKKGVEYAKVVNVEPITRTLSHRIPEETCWNERVRYEKKGHSSATPALIGGIIGAAIGDNLGKKNHRDGRIIKTIALGTLGASIGHDIGRKSSRGEVHYGTEQRCDVSYHTRYEEEVVGYNVSYRYHGKTYHTEMDYHPGKKIPVKVKVRPIL